VKEITIISGKGGTGKTTVTAALATAGRDLVLCDGDVDAPDLHLILQPEIMESHVFEGNWIASIDPEVCANCGICEEYCRFDAIILNQEMASEASIPTSARAAVCAKGSVHPGP
jgi:MinD superfamily P-loop ATPase